MSMQIRSITVDCVDPYRQAVFWSQITGWSEDPNDPNHPGDPEGRIVSGHGISLLFIPVPEGRVGEPRTGRRIRFGVMPTGRIREAEVERLLATSAIEYEDDRKPDRNSLDDEGQHPLGVGHLRPARESR